MSFYQKRQLDFEKQCRLLGIDADSPEALALRKTSADANKNKAFTNAAYTNSTEEVRIPFPLMKCKVQDIKSILNTLQVYIHNTYIIKLLLDAVLDLLNYE